MRKLTSPIASFQKAGRRKLVSRCHQEYARLMDPKQRASYAYQIMKLEQTICICILRCLVCIVVSCLVCIVVILLHLLCYVCIAAFTLDAGLLARSQYSEGPATGHLDRGFSRFPCIYKQMLRWVLRFQVATTCFSLALPN